MEGCPDTDLNVLYMILAALIGTFLFFVYETVRFIVRSSKTKKILSKQSKMKDDEVRDLQVELYGEGVLLKDSLSNTNHSSTSKSRKNVSNSSHAAASKQPVKAASVKPAVVEASEDFA